MDMSKGLRLFAFIGFVFLLVVGCDDSASMDVPPPQPPELTELSFQIGNLSDPLTPTDEGTAYSLTVNYLTHSIPVTFTASPGASIKVLLQSDLSGNLDELVDMQQEEGHDGTVSLTHSFSVPIEANISNLIIELLSEDGVEYTYAVLITRNNDFDVRRYVKSPVPFQGDEFFASSIDFDGRRVVVGANREDGDADSTFDQPNILANAAGAVFVYVLADDGSLTLEQYIKAPNAGSLDSFGASVAIAGDTMIIGARGEDSAMANGIIAASDFDLTAASDDSGRDHGAVYVYYRDASGVWEFAYYIKNDTWGNDAQLGYIVDAYQVSATTTLLALTYSPNAMQILERNITEDGDTLEHLAYLNAPSSTHESSDDFGQSFAMNERYFVVGAAGESSSVAVQPIDNAASQAGAVYVYARNADNTINNAPVYLKSPRIFGGDRFGYSLALKDNLLIVGALGENSSVATDVASVASATAPDASDLSAVNSGAVYSFITDDAGATWDFQNILKEPAGEAGNNFGISLAFHHEILVVGSPGENGSASSQVDARNRDVAAAGAVYAFKYNASADDNGAHWEFLHFIKAGNASSNDFFGNAIATHFGKVFVAAQQEDGDSDSNIEQNNENAVNSGALYYYD